MALCFIFNSTGSPHISFYLVGFVDDNKKDRIICCLSLYRIKMHASEINLRELQSRRIVNTYVVLLVLYCSEAK